MEKLNFQPVPISFHRTRGSSFFPACCGINNGNSFTGFSRASSRRSRNTLTTAKLVSDISLGDEFIGTVRNVGPAESSWIDIGATTLRGKPVHARLRFSRRGKGEDEGSVIPVHVIKADTAAARIEVRKGLRPKEEQIPEDTVFLEHLRTGKKLKGNVVALGKYGAVIDAGIYHHVKRGKIEKITGLLQRRDFPDDWGSSADVVRSTEVETVISIGDAIDVWVREALPRNAFLLFDAAEVDIEKIDRERLERHRRRKRKQRLPRIESLTVGEHRNGSVVRTEKYGLFVDVGVKRYGLIHYSEMGDEHRWDWKDVIPVGTKVVVEVIGVSDKKLSLRLLTPEEELDMLGTVDKATARVSHSEAKGDLGSTIRDISNGVVDTLPEDSKPLLSVATATSSPDKLNIHGEGSDDEEVEDKEVKDEEADVEDEDKFSDEYFEDKYGF